MHAYEPLDYFDLNAQYTPEEREARDRTRQFVETEVMPVITQAHRDAVFPEGLIPRMGAAGLFGPFLQGYGCAGLNHVAYGLMMQELERADSGIRSLASVQGALVVFAIHQFGSQEQRARWLPGLVAGHQIGAFALTEHAHGSDPGGMETHARLDGDHVVLNGSKCWIGNASIADVVVVWAKGEDGRVGGYLLEKDTPGFRARDIDGKFSLRASRTCEFWLEDCRIPAANRLPEAHGLRAPLACLSKARFGISWGVIGAATDCFHAALAYAKQREQFGRPIAGFQLVQQKFAEMATQITTAQLLALQLGRLLDEGVARPQQVSMAKRNNVRMALECARVSRDILGGVGITDRHPVIRHLLNLETVYTYEGTHDIHTLVLGQDLTGLNAFGG
jgi:alkylation response protein AidB-like acyl-CoA dehydrogenase